MAAAVDALDDFSIDTFTHQGVTKDVLRKGSGPGVVVMTEVPGITPHVADFARRVAADGFQVAVPDLMGTPGMPESWSYMLGTLARLCISREFALFAANRTSPVTVWLRALARDLHDRCGGPGVGAVGMCLTGNFALAMAVDAEVLVPVLSQPSLPVLPHQRTRLHLGDDDLARVRQRTQDEGLEIVGLRFRHDRFCPTPRFDRLQEEFGDAFIRVDLDEADANPRGRPMPPHSVLTTDLIDEPGEPTRAALELVLDLLHRKLDTKAT